MAHLHSKDESWSNANLTRYVEDLFECKKCKIEFAIDSDKVRNKKVHCPLCIKPLKAWQKEWES